MKRLKKLVAKNGSYTRDGQEKTRWLTVGTLLQREDGSLTVKLDALPAGEFDGWLSCYDFEDEQGGAPKAQPQAQQQGMIADGDVPF